MKIKVTEQIEREIEICFPCSMSDGNTFVYFEKENEYGTVIMENIHDISQTKIIWLSNFKELKPCDKSEVEAAFNRVVKYHRDKSFSIVVSMDDNVPTELLENLNK